MEDKTVEYRGGKEYGFNKYMCSWPDKNIY